MTDAASNEPGAADSPLPPELKTPDGAIPGERGIPSVNRARSIQSRVTTFLAVAFISVMTLGLLGWYYGRALSDPPPRGSQAHRKLIQGESKLPPLGRLHMPRTTSKEFWGEPPPLPEATTANPAALRSPASAPNPSHTANQFHSVIDRRLVGPVASTAHESFTPAKEEGDRSSRWSPPATLRKPHEQISAGSLSALTSGPLGDQLTPTTTAPVTARVLPTQRLLIPKGSFIDCTLETAIDTSLPGLVTCITATDVFSADGTTVLLDRGTKLTGETKGGLKRGIARVFILWTEARTPTGVVAQLDSPGTDELGRSGLPGRVNRHFFERFGAALLVSVIEAAIDRATRPSGGGNVILNTTGTEGVVTEVLKDTVRIPPTLVKHQGDRIQVLVARDIDFRSVYDLRSLQ